MACHRGFSCIRWCTQLTGVLVRRYTPYMKIPAGLRSVVAARVSHLQDDGKTSHVTQNTTGTKFSDEQQCILVGEVEDLDVSAIKLGPWERPDLKVWLTDRAHEFDVLIFSKTDRVFRRADDSFLLTQWAKQHKKILVLVDDGIVIDFYTPEDQQDPMTAMLSRMFLFMASFFAEMEARRFVQRAKDRAGALRHTDRWSHSAPPFGFKIVGHPSGEGKSLAHDDWPQEVLHFAAQKLLSGWSPNKIRTVFNDERVLTSNDWLRLTKNRVIKESKWTPSRVRRMLTSPATQGWKMGPNDRQVLTSEGEPIRVGPPSFDDDTWNQIQQTIIQRAYGTPMNQNSPNPLLGVAKCGVCKRNLRQRNQEKGPKTYSYQLCEHCPIGSGVSSDMEALVYDEFITHYANRRIRIKTWVEGSDVSSELEQTLLTISNLREDRAMGLFTTPEDQAVFRNQMTTLIAKRDQLASMPITKPGWALVESDETYGDVWAEAGSEYRREMLIAAGVSIYLHEGRVYEVRRDLDNPTNDGLDPDKLLADVLEAQEQARVEAGF